jgi:hypothetical protein
MARAGLGPIDVHDSTLPGFVWVASRESRPPTRFGKDYKGRVAAGRPTGQEMTSTVAPSGSATRMKHAAFSVTMEHEKGREALSYPRRGRDKAELFWRGTQVVRERSAKPLCVGSIPTRASGLSFLMSVS